MSLKTASGRVTCSATVTVNNLDLPPFLIANALVMSNGEEMFVSLSFSVNLVSVFKFESYSVFFILDLQP